MEPVVSHGPMLQHVDTPTDPGAHLFQDMQLHPHRVGASASEVGATDVARSRRGRDEWMIQGVSGLVTLVYLGCR